jgi:hypothetical protein
VHARAGFFLNMCLYVHFRSEIKPDDNTKGVFPYIFIFAEYERDIDRQKESPNKGVEAMSLEGTKNSPS